MRGLQLLRKRLQTEELIWKKKKKKDMWSHARIHMYGHILKWSVQVI